jgi:SAM-dependent methyltransferase
MRYLQGLGHLATGVDRSALALEVAAAYGYTVLADIEAGPWPFKQDSNFDAVVVTNYLWRPLFASIFQSLAPGGVLIYETFATGQVTLGKPSNPDFLLQTGELLQAFSGLRVVAFEDGFLDTPARFVQRLAAVKPSGVFSAGPPARYSL